MARCRNNPAINGPHSLTLNGHGYYVCEFGCGYKKKAKFGDQNIVEIKGGKWGNKADKQLSKGKSRQNVPGHPQNKDEGCKDTAVVLMGLLGGGLLTSLYGGYELIKFLIA